MDQTEAGRVAVTDGWFVVNVADAAWVQSERGGAACVFEGGDAEFPHIGYTLAVLEPGKSGGLYHREDDDQEDFLVLAGEALLLVEGQERPLKTWDFVHCPPGTEHIILGAGDGPAHVLMIGSRRNRDALVYPRSELAARHGLSAAVETSSPKEAYAGWPKWKPGRPDGVWPP